MSIVEQFIQLDQVDSTTLHTALRAGNETATRLRGGEGEREGHRRGLLSGHCEIPRSPVESSINQCGVTTVHTTAVTSPHPRHMVRLLSTIYYLVSSIYSLVLGCSVAPGNLAMMPCFVHNRSHSSYRDRGVKVRPVILLHCRLLT